MPKPPLDHFGLIAPWFDRLIPPPRPERLLDLLELHPGMRLLDVGGGTGRISQAFVNSGAEIVLLDPSPGMLRAAQQKNPQWVLCQGIAEALPFASGSFERVLAVDSFHHFWEHARAAQELTRVLAPGGRLVIEEPDIRRLAVKLIALGETLTLMRSHFYPPQALQAFFQQPGIRTSVIESQEDFNFWLVVERLA